MDVKARIPGTIIALNVKAGDAVKVRDILGTMEAMKMEQPIPCPVAGEVVELRVGKGDRVRSGDVLAVVE